MRGILFGLAVSVGCGSSSGAPFGPTPQQALNAPQGDAVGSAFGGVYQIDVRTTACGGACASRAVDAGARECVSGERTTESMTVTQIDGQLSLDAPSGLPVSHLSGGVYRDAQYGLGGYERQGELDVSVTVLGSFSGDGTLKGTLSARWQGAIEGAQIRCTGTLQLLGKR